MKFKSFLKFVSWTLPLLLMSPALFAGVFDVPATDSSMQYLGILFGGNVGTITLGPTSNPTLSLMFERFNFVIITVGVIVLTWIGFISAVNTAREGRALGEKLTLWVPVRAMFGLLMMIPTPGTGYSVIQITIIWIVLNGVGAANSIWGVVLDQLQAGITPVGPSQNLGVTAATFANNPPPASPSGMGLVQAALNAKVCMHVLNNLPKNSNWAQAVQANNWGSVQVTTLSDPFVQPTIPPNNALPQIWGTGSILIGYTNPAATDVYGDGVNPSTVPNNQPLGPNRICGWFPIRTYINPPTANMSSPTAPNLSGNNSYNQASVLRRRDIKLAAMNALLNAVDPAAQSIAQYVLANINTLSANPQLITGASITSATAGASYAGTGTQFGYVTAGANAYINGIAQMGGGVRVPLGSTSGSTTAGWEVDAPDAATNETNLINALRQLGWIQAGSYYFALSKASTAGALDTDAQAVPATNNGIPYFMNPIPNGSGVQQIAVIYSGKTPVNVNNPCINQVSSPFLNNLTLQNSTFYELCAMELALYSAFSYVQGENSGNPQSNNVPIFGGNPNHYGPSWMDDIIQGMFGWLKNDIVNDFLGMTGPSGGEPLSHISYFGNTIMSTAENFVLGYIAAMVILVLATGSAYCISPLPAAMHSMILQLIFLVSGLFILLWSTGAMLGLYLPMVPYIIFLTTAFGWFIGVAEALVGAPIIALGLVHPSGEELGRATPAFAIITNLFLRPSLMIFGFVIAASLMRAGLNFVNFGFSNTVYMATNGLASTFGFPAILAMYMALVIAIVNKSFSLIHLLPEQILRWMGGQGEKAGDTSQMAQEGKGGFEKGQAGGQKAIGGISAQAQKKMTTKPK